jgi:hypothetical protein
VLTWVVWVGGVFGRREVVAVQPAIAHHQHAVIKGGAAPRIRHHAPNVQLEGATVSLHSHRNRLRGGESKDML